MPESTDPRLRIAPSSRGVSSTDVERAADALLRLGERPTIEKIRASLGGGSPNTINPLLDAWWKRLSARLDAGPAALHRLPESVAHVAEAP
jgi:Plasmid replication region DNA-binding N-term